MMQNLRWGVSQGLIVAAIALALLILRLAVVNAPFSGDGLSKVFVFFIVAGIGGGGALGLLRPLTGTLLGRLLATFIALVPVTATYYFLYRADLQLEQRMLRALIVAAFATPATLLGIAVSERLMGVARPRRRGP